MNTGSSSSSGADQLRSLQILDELAANGSITQRDLSSRLGIALGLVNSYIKNLVNKGYLTVKAIPPKRYAYYLTPKGFSEKTRLTYTLLQDYTRIYREARSNLRTLFQKLRESGVRTVVLAGADEVAEIAYLTLQDTDIGLAGVVDDGRQGEMFFGNRILPLDRLQDTSFDAVIVATYLKRKEVYQELLRKGIDRKKISTIF